MGDQHPTADRLARPQAPQSRPRCSNQEHNPILPTSTQQAGRSATHLAAQQSAQSLREANRSASQPPAVASHTPKLPAKNDRQSPKLVENLPPPQTTRQHPLFLPNVSSPLNPTTHRSHATVGRLRPARKGVSDLYVPYSNAVFHHRSSPALRTPPEIQLPDGTDIHATTKVSRLYTPRSVRDLGSDYTRFFDPVNAIQGAPAERPIEVTSTTGMELAITDQDNARRFSNPFTDSKRISNPFEPMEDAGAEFAHSGEITPVRCEQQKLAPKTSSPPTCLHDTISEKMPFFQYLDDRLGAPELPWPLITDQSEDDDDLHMPKWDDDIRLKARFKDHFTRDSIISTFGLLLMTSGLLFAFVILPIISYTGVSLLFYPDETPLSEMPGNDPPPVPWSWVNNRKYPLLTNIRTGLIDPDTPSEAAQKTGVNGESFVLVFSDEFNTDNRTFYPGDDAYWFGFDGWYSATNDLEWYDPDAINTVNGTLLIQMDRFENHNLDFRSGMLNSWNQLCFKGGIMEISVSLPGPAGVHGLWPGMWTMGNLGRPGYLATTDGLWPYTYNECDAGITPNQSSMDGISYLPGQRLPSCTCQGEDHPTPGIGRGAPEIDVAEVSASWGDPYVGVATQSFQVAPFDVWYYPNYRFMQNPNYDLSLRNSWTGGPFQQAVSTTTMLNDKWYDGEQYQTFAFEYSPGTDKDAYVAWIVGGEEMMRFDARAVGPNGNIGQRVISEEPMSIILNLGISNNWVSISWSDLRFPTVMSIDYVRWYQLEDSQMVTCDPPGYETTEYIANHPVAYKNQNKTHWDETGYPWPKNTLVNGCES